MKKLLFLFLSLFVVFGLLFKGATHARAQETGGSWTAPYQLSTDQRKASEAALVTDSYGFVHAFWSEELGDTRSVIQYARFDGNNWSTPIDIFRTEDFITISNVSAAIDKNEVLHVVWSEGMTGPVRYTEAPASQALSARIWENPIKLNIPADRVYLQIDSDDVYHLLYIKFLGDDQGVYYTRSTDHAITWSGRVRLDPDIPADYAPRSLSFELDENDGLHAAWYYVPREAVGGDWVRYTHSLNHGQDWSKPLTIDYLGDPFGNLDFADPVMAISGRIVLIVWASGDNFIYRYYQFSTDYGNSWSSPERFFGDLNGQAYDGLAVDGLGRIHYFAQVRFPQGIYHAVWDQQRWSTPELVYFMRASSDDSMGSHIQAHWTKGVVRLGNQLVLTFTDPPPDPKRRLFEVHLTLQDVPPVAPIPTSAPIPTAASTPIPTEMPTPIASTEVVPFKNSSEPDQVPSPAVFLWYGIAPSIAVVIGSFAYFYFKKNRR